MDTDAITDRRRLKRRLAFWRILAVAAIVGMLAVLFADRREIRPLGDRIARINLGKIIREDDARERVLQAIAKDDRIKALIVRINTPGGTTTGSEALFHNLRAVAEKKPVVAVIGTIGTSGGYIAAIASDHIVARETSLTGSVGVLMEAVEFTGLMDKIGVAAETISSGDLKGQPLPTEKMDPNTRDYVQSMIDDSFSWFIDLVRERRQMNDAQLATIRDGRVVTGRQALKLGLVDSLGGEKMARDWLQEKHELAADMKVVNMGWEEPEGWLRQMLSRALGENFRISGRELDGLMSIWQPKLK